MSDDPTGSDIDRHPGGEAWWDESDLMRVVEAGLASLQVAELRRVLGSPFLTERVVRAILKDNDALGLAEVRRRLVAHPSTPLVDAQRLLSTLFWSDLVQIGRDARTPPAVRRSAHRFLAERYDGLSVGERVAIVRRADGELLRRLRQDAEPRVVQGMLENPRLTEGILLPLLASGRASEAMLRMIAGSERWISRYQVRAMLCRNRRTPADVVLPLLARLKKVDLAVICRDGAVCESVRRRAALLLGDLHPVDRSGRDRLG